MFKAILYIIGLSAIVGGIEYVHNCLFPNGKVPIGVMYLGIFLIVFLIFFTIHFFEELKKIREGFPNHYYVSSTEQEKDRNLGWSKRILYLMIKSAVEPVFIIAVLLSVRYIGR